MITTTHSTDMFDQAGRVREVQVSHRSGSLDEIAASGEPVILRGFVGDWPVVAAAQDSVAALQAYLNRFDSGAVVPISAGPATCDWRRIRMNP